MPNQLKDRQRQIPNGLTFYQPETKWQPSKWSSFDSIVSQVIAHRQGNQWLMTRNGWSIERPQVEREVDIFNTKMCESMGWADYVTGGASPPPIAQPRLHNLLHSGKNVVAGAETLVEWIGSGAEAVANELAEKRAGTCAMCPLNNTQDELDTLFTRVASAAIRKALGARQGMNLSTSFDAKLGVCNACSCPLKLKVHVPLEKVLARIPERARTALHPACWITNETK